LRHWGSSLLEGVHLGVRGLRGGLVGVLLGFWRLLGRIALLIWRALVLVFGALMWLIRLMLRGVTGTGQVLGRGAQNVAGNAVSARRVMARRAERSSARDEIEVGYVEDPLRTQNRTLSFLVVGMGFVLVGALIWATSLLQTRPTAIASAAVNGGDGSEITFVEDVTPTATIVSLVNTPVPTATEIPSILEVRGSLVFTARERGQQDLWVVSVGSSNPIRLTNDPSDERDPVWSPDGQQLAYASHRDGNWELYVYDVITEERTRLTYDLSFQGHPSWSPDGAFVVYESYQGNNLDLYVMPVDGSSLPQRLTDSDALDFAPSWSPDGRRIAFVSTRDGNQDIYVYSLDNGDVVNVTQTQSRDEEHPVWSPGEGELLAFSALDEGIEKVFVKSAADPNAPAQVLERGRTPSWSPDGTSLVFAVDSIDSTHMVASPFAEVGVTTEIIPVLLGSSDPDWTAAPLPSTLVNGGGVGPAIANELYVEQVAEFDTDPPFRLDTLVGVDAPNPVLNDNVNDSFNALREKALEVIGYDALGELEDAFWQIDRPPQPGEERRNWHMTGRAFAINRNGISGFPPPIEIVREDVGVNTYWRVYVRVAEQNGQLGEPLRQIPWDFAARTEGDVEAYDAGGRLRESIPEGYYVDLTQLAADYGWEWSPAGRDWRGNFNSTNYWMFRKTNGLTWFEAMREIYTEPQLGGFVPTATPPPASPLTEGTDTE
jgi:hypothetical protein